MTTQRFSELSSSLRHRPIRRWHTPFRSWKLKMSSPPQSCIERLWCYRLIQRPKTFLKRFVTRISPITGSASWVVRPLNNFPCCPSGTDPANWRVAICYAGWRRYELRSEPYNPSIRGHQPANGVEPGVLPHLSSAVCPSYFVERFLRTVQVDQRRLIHSSRNCR